MSFLNKIEELRNKPEHVRYKILTASLIAIMAVVVSVWISVIKIELEPKQEKNDSIIAPAGAISDTVKEAFSSIKSRFESLFKEAKYKYEP